MLASVHMQVPNLTAKGNDIQAKLSAKSLGVSVQGMGESEGKVGFDGTVDLSVSPIFNTEAQIIAKLYNAVALLLEKDLAAAPVAMFTRATNALAANPDNLCAKALLDTKVQGWISTLR